MKGLVKTMTNENVEGPWYNDAEAVLLLSRFTGAKTPSLLTENVTSRGAQSGPGDVVLLIERVRVDGEERIETRNLITPTWIFPSFLLSLKKKEWARCNSLPALHTPHSAKTSVFGFGFGAS